MQATIFHVKDMDCSSEEQMIRMHLDGVEGIASLDFNLPERRLRVLHDGSHQAIVDRLSSLNLGARLIEHTEEGDVADAVHDYDMVNRAPLMWALTINFTLFGGELVAGLIAGSMGLVADSLDMLADSLVYALSLVAIGSSTERKRRLAASSGYLQGTLAVLGLIEVARRFAIASNAPDVWPMIVVSLVALAANVATLMILSRTTRGEAHIEASWIFTSNDIKVNALVIVAGLVVWWTSSQVPDLVAGALIFLIVANGTRRILALARRPAENLRSHKA